MTTHPRRLRRFRFLRSLRPSDGSAAADVAVAMDLDRQLDAWVTGMSTPASLTSSATDEHAQLEELTSAFQEVAAMDATTRKRTKSSTAHAKAIIWEDIMSATTAIPSSSRPSDTPEETTWARKRVERSLPPAARSQNSTLPRWPSRPTLSPVLNVAMVAIMLLTLGLGAFAIAGGSDRWGLGGNGDAPGSGGVNGLASPPAKRPGIPAGKLLLPTVDECAVTPLTIDQVMDRIRGPFPGESGYPSEEIRLLSTPVFSGSPSQKTIDQIAAVHREFMACIMKGNMFQIWTFFAPGSDYWKNILQNYPRFVDEATIRADLEKVNQGERVQQLAVTLGIGAPQFSIPVVNPDPTASTIQVEAETEKGRQSIITVSMLYYNIKDYSATPILAGSQTPNGQYNPWVYEWDTVSGTWKVRVPGTEGIR
ncbi:MAG: hypothetical protein ACR2OE_18080 [Thermomicrobiales bacterium]